MWDKRPVMAGAYDEDEQKECDAGDRVARVDRTVKVAGNAQEVGGPQLLADGGALCEQRRHAFSDEGRRRRQPRQIGGRRRAELDLEVKEDDGKAGDKHTEQ